MSARRDPTIRLHDILEAIEGIHLARDDLSFSQFQRDWIRRKAIERGVEIISEASRHVSTELKDAEPAVPWAKIAGIGNILRHGYDHVQDDLIYEIAVDHLDELEAAVRRLLARLEG